MAATNLGDPAAWGVALHEAKLNGRRHRWADTASSEEERRRPVILFMHGWPESWFSWRHQLKAVGAAGFRGIAPDMRGFGGTDAPEHMAHYNVYALAGDMLALLQYLGTDTALLVGHDHGAALGWKLALLHPDVFVCYMALSVPFGGRSPIAPITGMRTVFGDERKPESDPRFFYILHHQLPNAAADYASDTRAALMALYSPTEPDATAKPPPVADSQLFVNGRSEPQWRRLPQPTAPAPWLSQAEFDYFVKEFERTGWNGGLNWYRVMDLDWHMTPQLEGQKVKQPVVFIAGSRDGVIMMGGGKKLVIKNLKKSCEQLEQLTIIDHAGHWIQQEKHQEVTQALLEFAAKHRSKLSIAAVPRSRL